MEENKILKLKAIEAINMIDKPAIYFAHPINYYNTPKEKFLIKKIAEELPEYKIYNPNQKHNQENYQLWKKETGNGMEYYFNVILPQMDAGIFLPFFDGMWGAGVFGEAGFLKKNGKTYLEN